MAPGRSGRRERRLSAPLPGQAGVGEPQDIVSGPAEGWVPLQMGPSAGQRRAIREHHQGTSQRSEAARRASGGVRNRRRSQRRSKAGASETAMPSLAPANRATSSTGSLGPPDRGRSRRDRGPDRTGGPQMSEGQDCGVRGAVQGRGKLGGHADPDGFWPPPRGVSGDTTLVSNTPFLELSCHPVRTPDILTRLLPN